MRPEPIWLLYSLFKNTILTKTFFKHVPTPLRALKVINAVTSLPLTTLQGSSSQPSTSTLIGKLTSSPLIHRRLLFIKKNGLLTN